MSAWGWNDRLQAEYQSLRTETEESSSFLRARVIGEEKGFLRIICEDSSFVWARFARKEKEIPAVGDWLLGRPMPGTNRILFEKLLSRKSWIARREAGADASLQMIGANIDTVFIVSSLNKDFNPKRIERYVALALDGHVRPVLVLSKADLVENVEDYIAQLDFLQVPVDILVVSILHEDSLAKLSKYCEPAVTLAFVGSSGVGKSSLVNYLLGNSIQKTAEIGVGDKGRHTTSTRMIFQIPNKDICILDTPGMREVGLWIEGEGLKDLFVEIEDLSRQCKFSDCRHIDEPACRIQEALSKNEITQERFETYLKLQSETQFLARKSNAFLGRQEKKRQKKINKAYRQTVRLKKPPD